MKITDGMTNINIEKTKDGLQVRLLSTQFASVVQDMLPKSIHLTIEEENVILDYDLPANATSLAVSIDGARTRLDRLQLASKLAALIPLSGQFNIPFLHPENIYIVGERLFVVHFGFARLMAPVELDEAAFLARYKALITAIFHPNVAFEDLVLGESTATDTFTRGVAALDNIEELAAFVHEQVGEETVRVAGQIVSVPKNHYRFFKYFGTGSFIVAIIAAFFTYGFISEAGKQQAIITAQTSFLTNNHAQTQTDLQAYSVESLPNAARYVLAVSAINLSDLTMNQKQTILNTISLRSDDNTLNYWVYTGRGMFDEALNLAKNLGDRQLTLFAYTNLYEATKLNTTMNGAEKQALLDEYNKEIQELSQTLGQ